MQKIYTSALLLFSVVLNMAGTLNVEKISDGTNSIYTERIVNASARAWVNFNGTITVAIASSYNVSSITDNGTGNYTINFTNAFVDTKYSHVVGANMGSGFTLADSIMVGYAATNNSVAPANKTTSALQVLSANNNGANAKDLYAFSVVFFR